jgi:hypothetical protein
MTARVFNIAAHDLSSWETLRILVEMLQETKVMISQGFTKRTAWLMQLFFELARHLQLPKTVLKRDT